MIAAFCFWGGDWRRTSRAATGCRFIATLTMRAFVHIPGGNGLGGVGRYSRIGSFLHAVQYAHGRPEPSTACLLVGTAKEGSDRRHRGAHGWRVLQRAEPWPPARETILRHSTTPQAGGVRRFASRKPRLAVRRGDRRRQRCFAANGLSDGQERDDARETVRSGLERGQVTGGR
jgi:hypothetical protein